MNFIVWGLWHGLFQLIERILTKRNSILMSDQLPWYGMIFRRLYTLLVVQIGWVLFRADDLVTAMDYLKVMFGVAHPEIVYFRTKYYFDSFTAFIFVLAILFSTNLPQVIIKKFNGNTVFKKFVPTCGSICILILMVLCCVMTMATSYNPFIYFRF